jgi:hypothetical protein
MILGDMIMVEVIKQGTKNIAECPDCGSILKYFPADIWTKHDPPRLPDEFDGFDYYFIRCTCGSGIDVTSKVSSGIAERVRHLEDERLRSEYDL